MVEKEFCFFEDPECVTPYVLDLSPRGFVR